MKTIQSVDKAMLILNYIADHNGKATLSQISRGLGMAVTTLHGFISTLERWNLIQKDPLTNRYYLGLKLFQLGICCQEELIIKNTLHPYLEELCREFDETTHLAIPLARDEVLYIDTVECMHPLRMTSLVGTRGSMENSAFAMMLAQRNPAIAVPQELLDTTNDTQADGYCIKYEPPLDAYCLAVPVCNAAGEYLAGISMIIPAVRYHKQLSAEVIRRMQAIAAVLTA